MITSSKEEIEAKKARDLCYAVCDFCNKPFARRKNLLPHYKSDISIDEALKANIYCSKACKGKASDFSVHVPCGQCGTILHKKRRELNGSKSGKLFCGHACSATYNNSRGTGGSAGKRISKLEIWMAAQLKEQYPELEFHFNRKDTIGSELDIYIPSLKLAFELNGIFHYEPIFGDVKLAGIQNNDRRKFSACAERGIGLCIIDVSKHKYVKPSTCAPYLKIVTDIIDETIKMARKAEVESASFG